ncbi:MAG: division/cell wall cluster transcriptional repressor MraZ [Clostridia bacterium]|nr:division/cell wall cluster transcriptional repressor MraZ [Clostridia bacterium]
MYHDLTGEYQHNIDAKGRMIMPAKLREQLGDTFVMTKGLDGCLFVLPTPEWVKLDNELRDKPISTSRKIKRFFYASKTDCEIDNNGRILIPGPLREFAQIEKEVVVVGVSTRVEIWSKAKWNEQNAEFVDSSDEVALQMEELGI